MERHADGFPMGTGPGGGRRWRGYIAILAVAALLQVAGCAAIPSDDDLLFNAKRFDHFTCTNLSLMVAQVTVKLYQDPTEPGLPPMECGSYAFTVQPFQTNGFVPALLREPPATGICKVWCKVDYGRMNSVTHQLVVPDGSTARWNSASFWFGPTDEQRSEYRLCGEGVLYHGRVGLGE